MNWTRPELILATDLLAANGWHDAREHDPRVRELSRLLRNADFHPQADRPDNFRSPGSVSRKVADLATRVPGYEGAMTRGGALDKAVVDEFWADPNSMAAEAAQIRASLSMTAPTTGPRGGGRLISSDIGAWLLRCNPDTWDIKRHLADNGRTLDGTWTVKHTYRADLMQPGERVLFWVTASKKDRTLQRGLWGAGYVAGDTAPSEPGTDRGLWTDEAARRAASWAVPIEIEFFADPVTDADLRAAGITDLEIQRQPQFSNPSYITHAQLTALDQILPAVLPPSWERRVTINKHGAGFGTAEHNRRVEKAGMDAVIRAYEEADWAVANVSRDNLGWDITCTHPDGRRALVEIKGTSGPRPVVLLTANELRAAGSEPDWILAVVTNALTLSPALTTYSSADAVAAAVPFVARVDLTATSGSRLGLASV